MLHSDLLRVINTRQTWALIGSGPSNDAGCPSWDALLANARSLAAPDVLRSLDADPLYNKSVRDGDLPSAFQVVQDVAGRDFIEASVRQSLQSCREPGRIHQRLAELPFAGYITTNYDHLLERALNALEPGWIPVGNVGDEVRQASGTADRVVWHIHGAADLSPERSRLVITRRDYDEIYLDEASVLRQLKGLMAHRRVVIIGFGFRDGDVMQLMRAVGRFTDFNRPIYALVEKKGQFRRADDRRIFLRQYNVDVQPYKNEDGRHAGLRQTLDVYTALSLRRNLRFGQMLAAPPSYDPETTGLLIFNELAMSGDVDVPPVLRESILKSRVLSVCSRTRGRHKSQIADDVRPLLEAVSMRLAPRQALEQVDAALTKVIDELVADGLLVQDGDGLSLSEVGHNSVIDHTAASHRLEAQFDQSILTRIERLSVPLGASADRAARVVGAFFREAIRRRALGVALAFATGVTPTHQDYHALALLQDLGNWLDKAANEAEALVVVDAIQEVFRAPSEAETEYLGLAVQARFVVHLLGLDEDTLAARIRELRGSAFLVDSTTLIPWFAKGGSGHDAANILIQRLIDAGATPVTTPHLVIELAEHARWAQSAIRNADGVQTIPVFEAATGRAGSRSNAFLDGYLAFMASRGSSSFDQYLAHCLGVAKVSPDVTDAEVEDAIRARGMRLLKFELATAGDATAAARRRQYEEAIRERRLQGASFRHDRQVTAEAEAMILVERARNGTLSVDGLTFENGYFLSYSSLLNDISNDARPITMRAEAALSWLATLRPAGKEDTRLLMSELLWELQERRMNLVDQATLLTAFSPLLSATRAQLDEQLAHYQSLVAQRYGGGEEGEETIAAAAVADLDAPVVLDAVLAQRVSELTEVVAHQAREIQTARQQAAASEATAAELAWARDKLRKREKYQRRMDRQRQRPRGKGSKRR